MERYALQLPAPAFTALPGYRLVRVVHEDVDGQVQVSSEVLHVIGFQPVFVYHYASDSMHAVDPSFERMAHNGWRYKHNEYRYAPICVEAQGRICVVDSEELGWQLVEPSMPEEQLVGVRERLEQEARRRLTLEVVVENREQGNVEGD